MKATIPAGEMMERLTLEVDVTGVRVLRVRLWLGLRLLRLAALVMGCGIEIGGPK